MVVGFLPDRAHWLLNLSILLGMTGSSILSHGRDFKIPWSPGEGGAFTKLWYEEWAER